MAVLHGHSPYTVEPDGDLDYPMMESGAFAAPSLEAENGWVDPPGLGYADSPTPRRVGTADVVEDRRPNPARAPDEFWQPITDVPERHAVEDQDADGFEAFREGSGKRAAPHPHTNVSAEPRLTGRMSPHTYSFTRPFDTYSERQFNGFHFSMADHRRDFEVGGMQPVRTGRNTYRVEPPPWDQDIVDVPPSREPDTAQARIRQIELPVSLDRSYRLG